MIIAAIIAAFPASPAWARGRGGFGAQRRYMQMFQKQMKVVQKQVETMQAQQKAEEEAFMKRFDTNKNGKIDGKEKGPARKYLRDLEEGKDPDRAINNLSRARKSSSRKSSKAKRSTDASKAKAADDK
ncbi:MAG TPA: hypothetical protein VFW87_25225 [Pirellulales bacterium]|nr:hypothetical protein [Pirellulales bacterium]